MPEVSSQPSLSPTPPKQPSKVEFIIILICLGLILFPLAVFGIIVVPGPLQESVTVVIPHGINTRDMAALLAEKKVVNSALAFRVAARILTRNSLKSGEYAFTPAQSISDIIMMIHDGRSVVHWFTAPEGLTSLDITHMLNNNAIMTGDIRAIPPEGSLMPETYRYSYGDNRNDMVIRMQKHMQDMVRDVWDRREMNLPLKSSTEAVVLASVVEKETGKPEERPRIAGVFYNRLAHNMRLQSDPTVIYAIQLTKGPLGRKLSHEDLSFLSPINTYASDGLPSQPICNPGRAALEAVLHPENNDYFYFVANGTGGHAFAHSLSEHNKNVANYRGNKD